MYLTDEQIMLLEQLTYLTDDVADAAGVFLGPYDSVEDLLQQFDDDALQRLEDPGNPDSTKDYTGGKKWAAIIRQIKSDPDLYSLDMLKMVHLIRRKTGEDICINKESFWIGKDAGYVDYCITDNTAISRRHALITIRDDVCYIQDNHSTNRVFVNGYVLEAGVDTRISNGDVIRMGDEEFTVKIG